MKYFVPIYLVSLILTATGCEIMFQYTGDVRWQKIAFIGFVPVINILTGLIGLYIIIHKNKDV